MVDEHAHSDPESSAKSKSMTPAQARRQRLFGEPQLLEGENRAAYDELLARVWAAVNPADILDEMFIVDVMSLEWEILRMRRLKLRLIRKRAIEKLQGFLREELDYEFYRDYFVSDLAESLEINLPEDEASSALTLAQQYARDEEEEDAVEKVYDTLRGLSLEDIQNRARDRRVDELVRGYARRESEASALIDEVIIGAGKSLDDLVAQALVRDLDYVERIDHLIAVAEGRRKASLREIDRRRPMLAEMLRPSVQQIEHDELEVIETAPAIEESAI
jgi:hypothetical protein